MLINNLHSHLYQILTYILNYFFAFSGYRPVVINDIFLHFVEFVFVLYLLSVYNAVLCLLLVYNAVLCLLSVYNAVLYLLSVYNAVLCVMFCFFFNTEQYDLCGWTACILQLFYEFENTTSWVCLFI